MRILHLGRESRRLLWPPSALDREAQLSSCMVSEQTVPTIPRPWEYLCSMKLRVHLHGSILLPFASSQPSIRAACGAGLRTRRNGRTPKGETGRSDAASGCSQISMEKLTSPIYMVFTGLPPGLDILPPILKLASYLQPITCHGYQANRGAVLCDLGLGCSAQGAAGFPQNDPALCFYCACGILEALLGGRGSCIPADRSSAHS